MGFVVACESCGKQLTIPPGLYEKRVRGRVVTIACKACSAPIRIDASVPPPPVAEIIAPGFGENDGIPPAPRLPGAELSADSRSELPPSSGNAEQTEVDSGWDDAQYASLPPVAAEFGEVSGRPRSEPSKGPPPLPPAGSPLWNPSTPAPSEPPLSSRRLPERRDSPRPIAGLTGLAMPASSRPPAIASGAFEPVPVEPDEFQHATGPISIRPPIARVGRYALFDKFASGGMATVHLGRLDGAGGFTRVVAIKRLLPHLVENSEFAEMLLKEARLAARVRHPNVVPTLDVVASRGEVLLVLEYVHGEALGSLCRAQSKRREPIPTPIAVSVMVGTLQGLHAVHESTDERGHPLGLVHRDVSPPNVLVGVDGMARVLDFGIVKALEQLEETVPNRLKGKTGYMSPEQIRGQRLTRTSDVFAAGIVLWELLTLKRFVSSSSTDKERLDFILEGNYSPPSAHRPEVTPALDAVVMRALAPKVEDRFASAREFADALQQEAEVASSGAVADWVRGLCEDTLTVRARMVAQVENWNDGTREIELSSSPFAGERDALTQPAETPSVRNLPKELRVGQAARSPAATSKTNSIPARADTVSTQRLSPLDPARLSSLAPKWTMLVLLGIVVVLFYLFKH